MAALIIAVYVDNNACRFNCIELLEEFEAFLKEDGQIKMLREGMLEWLLGVRYYFDEVTGAVSCNQQSNIENILRKWGLQDCHATQLPLSPSVDLESLPLAERLNEDVLTSYTSLVGELIYIAINLVPQICYVLSAPDKVHDQGHRSSFQLCQGRVSVFERSQGTKDYVVRS